MKKTVTITMDHDVWTKAKKVSYKNNTTFSSFVNEMLKNHLFKKKDEKIAK